MALKKSKLWINKSASGKGLRLYVEDTLYTCAVSQMERLLKDEIKGVNLSKQVVEKEEEE